MSEPTQPSLRRLKQFGIRPVRDLGQNFLIDSNLLDVIAREAGLGPEDVVLEVGGGLGVLSEHLARTAAHVHVVEVDERLEPALRDALDPFANTTLHFGDAVKLDYPALDPAPTKVIANLPYGVAATVILDTVAVLPTVTRWVAMVQREVGERLAAKPGTPAYGAPSVLAQLSCDVKVARAVSRTVFHPVPNVDSVLVRLERSGPPAPRDVRRLVSAGFAHRRKALPRSLSLAGAADRDAARAALAGARPSGGRPRGAARAGGMGRARGGAPMTRLLAPGKVNLCLFVGRPRADGYHPLVSIFQSVTLADELVFEPAERDEVICPGVDGPNLAERALAASRAAGWDGPPVRVTIIKRIPVAAGMGGGSADAAAVLRYTGGARDRAHPRRRRPLPARHRPRARHGHRRARRAAPARPARRVRRLPEPAALSTPAVYREADRLQTTRDDLATPERDLRAGLLPNVNDLQDAARSLEPSIDPCLQQLHDAGADQVLVAGSGPTTFGSFDDPERAAAVARVLPGAIAVEPC